MLKYLLVDGYNIIFSWVSLKNIATQSLDNARNKLTNMLNNFAGFTGERIILVFDAHKVNGGVEVIKTTNNIITVYTKEKETADVYIERTSRTLAKKYTVRVATSDVTEQIIIIGQEATVISSTLFEEEVNLVMSHVYEIISKKPIKNNMLIDNLDKGTAKMLEELRNTKT